MRTPLLRYSRAAIHKNIAKVTAAVNRAISANRRIRWAPQLSGRVPAEVLAIVRNSTTAASCRTVQEALRLAAAGFQSLVITRPVCDPEELSCIPELAQSQEVIVTIDHFRHAELLSYMAVAGHVNVKTLIDVELGQRLTGVRPGTDAVRLSSAVSELPGVQLHGVLVDKLLCPANLRAREPAVSFNDAMAIARHCQRTIESAGMECCEIAAGQSGFQSGAELLQPSILLTGPFAMDTSPAVLRLPEAAAIHLVCRVISRPSLELCVINAGAALINSAAGCRVIHPAGAQLLHTHCDVSALELSNDALDLCIGDEVLIQQQEVPHCLDLPFIIAE